MDQTTAPEFLRRIGRNIKAERARRDWTQEALAHASGVGVAQVARMERGEMDTGITKYMRIASALGVPTATLLQGVE